MSAVHARTALIDRFHDDVQALYFRRRARLGGAALASVSDTLVRATSVSAAARRATVRHVDILNSRDSLLSAVEFNAGARVFAAAGVARRIKLYQLDALLAGAAAQPDGLHCPVLEIAADSKVTSLSWSRDRPAVLAAAAFSGAVAVHDTEVNARVHHFTEHTARAWSLDFSAQQPGLLLSGADDNTVRLWDVGRAARAALTLPTKASVCSVRFNPHAAHELAYGSADHFVYSVDIRFPRTPMCVFEGHWRAVSYVLFLNRAELVSASTDSSCKLWNVREHEPGLSYGGHVNERNFVGLCGNADFFACGSEDCSVYVYHKDLTGPVVRYGLESQASFVSSVCWKPGSNTLIAASNTGSLEVLDLL
jgi:E3 ubiquitin-protein ligase RFWD2